MTPKRTLALLDNFEGGGNGEFIPIGAILDFPVNTVPVGFLVCAGQVVTRAAYPELVTYLTGGTTATTATVPDYRGTVSRAADLGRGLAPDVVVGGYLSDTLKDHGHDVQVGLTSTWPTNSVNASGVCAIAGGSGTYVQNAAATGKPFVQRSGDVETRGKSYGVVRCIKAYHAPMSATPVDLTDALARLDAMAAVVSPEVGKYCIMGHTTGAQSIPAATLTTVMAVGGINRLAGEAWDDAGDGSISIVVPEAGTYEMSGMVATTSGTGFAEARITINGTQAYISAVYGPVSTPTTLQPILMRQLQTGDIVGLSIQSAAALTLRGPGNVSLTVKRVR